MKASKARKITFKNNLSLSTETENIYDLIRESAESGNSELYLDVSTDQSILNHLNFDLGYIIESKEEKKSGMIVSLKITW